MTYCDLIADFGSFRKPIKTKNGKPFILVATQTAPRESGQTKTNYIYHLEGTSGIYYNMDKNDYRFAAVCRRSDNMSKWYDALVKPPLTPAEQDWAKRKYVEILQ